MKSFAEDDLTWELTTSLSNVTKFLIKSQRDLSRNPMYFAYFIYFLECVFLTNHRFDFDTDIYNTMIKEVFNSICRIKCII